MTLKGQKKRWMPRRMARERAGWQRRDLPACFRRAGLLGCRDVVEYQRDARGFCRQRETSARGEIEHPRFAPEFDDDSPEPRTARAFQPGLQHSGGVACLNEDEALRHHTKSGQPRRIGRPGFPAEYHMANPEHGALPGGDPRCCERKSGCGCAIGFARGMEIEIGGSGRFRSQEGRQYCRRRGLCRLRCQGRTKGNACKGERDRHI